MHDGARMSISKYKQLDCVMFLFLFDTREQRVFLSDDFAFCLSLFSCSFASRDHRSFESFSIFPACRGEVRIGFIRVFNEGLSRLRAC